MCIVDAEADVFIFSIKVDARKTVPVCYPEVYYKTAYVYVQTDLRKRTDGVWP